MVSYNLSMFMVILLLNFSLLIFNSENFLIFLALSEFLIMNVFLLIIFEINTPDIMIIIFLFIFAASETALGLSLLITSYNNTNNNNWFF